MESGNWSNGSGSRKRKTRRRQPLKILRRAVSSLETNFKAVERIVGGMLNTRKGTIPFRSILIFGGAGFIGSNWAERLLLTTDAKIHIFDNLSRPGVNHNLAALRRLAGSSTRLKVTTADIRDKEQVTSAVHTATEIYHFAAQVAVTTSLQNPRLDFEVNVGGTLNILEAARTCGYRPLVLFTSTNKVYGKIHSTSRAKTAKRILGPSDCISEAQPLDFFSPYGCSKGAADQYVRDYARMFGLPTVVFRMSCIAGPHQFGNEDQGWVAHFLYSALHDNPISIYGDGQQVRDVLCVDDLLRAFEGVRANRGRTAGEVYNVGGGLENAVSLMEVIEEVRRLTGKELPHQFRSARPGDQPIYVSDYSKLRSHIGWRPMVSVQDTLKRIHSWWQTGRDSHELTLPAVGMTPQMCEEIPEVAS